MDSAQFTGRFGTGSDFLAMLAQSYEEISTASSSWSNPVSDSGSDLDEDVPYDGDVSSFSTSSLSTTDFDFEEMTNENNFPASPPTSQNGSITRRTLTYSTSTTSRQSRGLWTPPEIEYFSRHHRARRHITNDYSPQSNQLSNVDIVSGVEQNDQAQLDPDIRPPGVSASLLSTGLYDLVFTHRYLAQAIAAEVVLLDGDLIRAMRDRDYVYLDALSRSIDNRPALNDTVSSGFKSFLKMMTPVSLSPIEKEDATQCAICCVRYYHSENDAELKESKPASCAQNQLGGGSPTFEYPIRLPCNHIFGSTCIMHWLAPWSPKPKSNCPLCRAEIPHEYTKSLPNLSLDPRSKIPQPNDRVWMGLLPEEVEPDLRHIEVRMTKPGAKPRSRVILVRRLMVSTPPFEIQESQGYVRAWFVCQDLGWTVDKSGVLRLSELVKRGTRPSGTVLADEVAGRGFVVLDQEPWFIRDDAANGKELACRGGLVTKDALLESPMKTIHAPSMEPKACLGEDDSITGTTRKEGKGPCRTRHVRIRRLRSSIDAARDEKVGSEEHLEYVRGHAKDSIRNGIAKEGKQLRDVKIPRFSMISEEGGGSNVDNNR